MADRQGKRKKGRSRRDRKGEPPKRKAVVQTRTGAGAGVAKSRVASRTGVPQNGGPANRAESTAGESPAEAPGLELGDLSHVRKDLFRILSLAGVMLLLLVGTTLALG